jgi:hypothetical protein
MSKPFSLTIDNTPEGCVSYEQGNIYGFSIHANFGSFYGSCSCFKELERLKKHLRHYMEQANKDRYLTDKVRFNKKNLEIINETDLNISYEELFDDVCSLASFY